MCFCCWWFIILFLYPVARLYTIYEFDYNLNVSGTHIEIIIQYIVNVGDKIINKSLWLFHREKFFYFFKKSSLFGAYIISNWNRCLASLRVRGTCATLDNLSVADSVWLIIVSSHRGTHRLAGESIESFHCMQTSSSRLNFHFIEVYSSNRYLENKVMNLNFSRTLCQCVEAFIDAFPDVAMLFLPLQSIAMTASTQYLFALPNRINSKTFDFKVSHNFNIKFPVSYQVTTLRFLFVQCLGRMCLHPLFSFSLEVSLSTEFILDFWDF